MRELLKLLAALCSVLFIITSVSALFLFNIESRAFSSATYKQAFEEQRLYERMPALLASTLQGTISQNPNAYPFLKELTVEDWQVTITSLLPPEELRALADAALDSTFDYLNNKTDTVIISLMPVKARLVGESGVTVVQQFLQTQPDCTIEQLTQMALGLLGGDIALCNPPPEAMSLVAPFLQSQLQTVTTAFPNEVILVAEPESGTPNDPRLRLHMVRSAIRFSPFFALLLFLAIAIFAVTSIRALLIWWGWPLLITGVISAGIALVGSPIIGPLLQFLIETQGAAFLPPLLASTIAETASAVASQMLVPVVIQGCILAALGLLMLGIAFFIRRSDPAIVA